jgi:hypothetical protein
MSSDETLNFLPGVPANSPRHPRERGDPVLGGVETYLERRSVLGRPVKPYGMHTSDSIVSVGTTENMSHQSH